MSNNQKVNSGRKRLYFIFSIIKTLVLKIYRIGVNWAADWSCGTKKEKFYALLPFILASLIFFDIGFTYYNENRGYPPYYPLQSCTKIPAPIYQPPIMLETYNLSNITKEPSKTYYFWQGWVNVSYRVTDTIFTDVNNDGYIDVILSRFASAEGPLPQNVSYTNTSAIDFHNNKVLWSLPEVGSWIDIGDLPLTDIYNNDRKELVTIAAPDEKLEGIIPPNGTIPVSKIVIVDILNGSIIREFGKDSANVFKRPIVADIDNDGIKEVIAPFLKKADPINNIPLNTQWMSVFNSTTGEEVLYDREFRVFFINGTAGTRYNNGTLASLMKIEFDTNVGDYFFHLRPVFAIDKENNRSVIIVPQYNGLPMIAFDALTGEILWTAPILTAYEPKIGDINGDGEPEVVISSFPSGANGISTGVVALRLTDGKVLWTFEEDMITSSPMGECSLGDLNGDGALDVVVYRDHGLFAINGKNGKPLWKYIPSLNYNSDVIKFGLYAPILADLDNDGKLDILLRGAQVLVKEKLTTPPTFIAFRGYDGKLLWNCTLEDVYIDCLPYVMDVDNDGHVEIIFTFVQEKSYGIMVGILHGTDDYPTGARAYYEANGGDWEANGNTAVFDPDGDTLSTVFEISIGTDPYSSDTDGDQLPDYYEYLTLHTSPLLVDSDNNGANDSFEDFDHDGLNNLAEFQLGTNPLSSDTDHDLLPDAHDPYPLFPDGRFYWSFGSIVAAAVSLPFIIKFIKKRKLKQAKESTINNSKDATNNT